MKQPYRAIVTVLVLIAIPALTTLLTVIHPVFAIGYVLWAIAFGLLVNEFHGLDFP